MLKKQKLNTPGLAFLLLLSLIGGTASIPAIAEEDQGSGLEPASSAGIEIENKTAQAGLQAQLRSKKVHTLEKPKGWEIELSYPQFDGGGVAESELAKLNEIIRRRVATQRNRVQTKGKRSDPPEISYWFRGDYEVLLATPELVSVVLYFNIFEGGAHGDNWSIPLNYRLKPETRELTLQEVFGKTPDLRTLSSLCRLDLYKQLKEGFSSIVKSGTNFSNGKTPMHFAFDKHRLFFYFDPYAVCDYSRGPQQVGLSFGKLRKLFAPASPLYKYVQASKDKALDLDYNKLNAEAEAAAVRFEAK